MKPHTLILLCCLTVLSSCVQSAPTYHVSTMTDEQWAASDSAINQMEDESFARRHQERIGRARAVELATRHNPTHVTTNTTTFWVW